MLSSIVIYDDDVATDDAAADDIVAGASVGCLLVCICQKHSFRIAGCIVIAVKIQIKKDIKLVIC